MMKRFLGNTHEHDLYMAKVCLACRMCRHAREKQKGTAFWLVKHIERKICPYCQAYQRIFGRYAHEATN